MAQPRGRPSARRAELLDAAYREVLAHGLADMSLRPLATAIGSSPRVLLFLFGSKDGLVRALLARARADELVLLDRLRRQTSGAAGPAEVTLTVWDWLADPAHRPLLVLWARGVHPVAGRPGRPVGRLRPGHRGRVADRPRRRPAHAGPPQRRRTGRVHAHPRRAPGCPARPARHRRHRPHHRGCPSARPPGSTPATTGNGPGNLVSTLTGDNSIRGEQCHIRWPTTSCRVA